MNAKAYEFVRQCEMSLADRFAEIDCIGDINLEKVLSAFRILGLTTSDLAGSTGYGLGDTGRDKLERVFAHVFGTESALARPQIASGTHAIAITLFGLLRPGDRMVSITGRPYDTLEEVIAALLVISGQSEKMASGSMSLTRVNGKNL